MSGGELAVLLSAMAVAGLLGGLLAGLLGVGGGIVIVPILAEVFGLLGVDQDHCMHLAVGTSLATIVPTAISSARAHLRKGAVDLGVLRGWSPAVVLGVILGTLLASRLGGVLLSGVFAVVALTVSVNMMVRANSHAIWHVLPKGALKWAIATSIGAFSALMGIGGGTLSVPVLTAFGLPIRNAIGTSAALGLIIGVPGMIGYAVSGWDVAGLPPLSVGYVSLPAVALLLPTSMLMAPIGAGLAHSFRPRTLSRLFALFLVVSAARMAHRALQ